jgi:hypothetical protein
MSILYEEDMAAEQSKTELDSHANMPFVGRHAFIISDTGRVAKVNAFTPDYDPMQLSIVDAAIQYDCPYDGQTYILVIRNACTVHEKQSNTTFCDARSRDRSVRHTQNPGGGTNNGGSLDMFP